MSGLYGEALEREQHTSTASMTVLSALTAPGRNGTLSDSDSVMSRARRTAPVTASLVFERRPSRCSSCVESVLAIRPGIVVSWVRKLTGGKVSRDHFRDKGFRE